MVKQQISMLQGWGEGLFLKKEKQHEILNIIFKHHPWWHTCRGSYMPFNFLFPHKWIPIHDCLNSNVCPFETNDLPFGACFIIPGVISTFPRPKLQHHYSHFITWVYEIMSRKKMHHNLKELLSHPSCTSKGDGLKTWTLGWPVLPVRIRDVCLPGDIWTVT